MPVNLPNNIVDGNAGNAAPLMENFNELKDFVNTLETTINDGTALPDGSVTTAKLDDGAVTAIKLASDAVTTAKMLDANVTRAKLAAGAVGAVTYTTKTGNYTVTTSDDVILCSGAAFTLTLFASSGNTGRVLTIKKTDSSLTNIITVSGDGGFSTTLNTIGETIVIVCDGTTWQVLDRKTDTGWVDAGTMTVTATSTNPNKATTPDIDSVAWRRVGGSAEIVWRYKQSSFAGASAGSGDYLYALPTGMTVDTTLFPSDTAGATSESDIYATQVGTASIGIDSGADGLGGAYLYDSSKVRARTSNAFSTYGSWGSGFFAFTVANNVGWTIRATVPISGWNN